jgi:hypothetical protein
LTKIYILDNEIIFFRLNPFLEKAKLYILLLDKNNKNIKNDKKMKFKIPQYIKIKYMYIS